jgi:hypothetical protein
MTTRAMTQTHTSFVAEQLIEAYPLATTDYDSGGNLKDEAAERIVQFVLARLTPDQRNELVQQETGSSAARVLEYCVECGAAETFRNNRGDLRYRKVRNLTEAEQAVWSARQASMAGLRQLIAARCHTAR